jgi:hypothetical protein
MSNDKKPQLRMLAPEGFREKLSRRAFLQGGTAIAGFALVAAACGGSSDIWCIENSTHGLILALNRSQGKSKRANWLVILAQTLVKVVTCGVDLVCVNAHGICSRRAHSRSGIRLRL